MTPWLLAEIVALVAIWLSAGWLAWPYLARRSNPAQRRVLAATALILLLFIVLSLLPPLPLEANVVLVIIATAGLMITSVLRLRRPGGISDPERAARRVGFVIQAAALILGLLLLALLIAHNGA
ncbi:MAG TPA: hypothetical protein VMH24_07030 [Candidatus Sulfotelmatobacter sp.]|nr:hypothetical protein [Candidatus Sulfotelmatobacter sp.]